MATSKAKTAPVGSAQWIQNEREQVTQLISQDVEEFGYSARNELDWLNEHMGEIFNNSQKNFTDIFKTPSRMRGKTPRTARKHDTLPARQPLTDLFAPNTSLATGAVQAIDFQNNAISFPIPSDENQVPQHRPISRGKSPNRAGIPYIDSGYHGMTEDEMDVDQQAFSIGEPSQTQEYSQPITFPAPSQTQEYTQEIQIHDDSNPVVQTKEGRAHESDTSAESFVSAEEAVVVKSTKQPAKLDASVVETVAVHSDEIRVVPAKEDAVQFTGKQTPEDVDTMVIDLDNQSQLDLSSPENPLSRKSSFTFSALPAREPLGTKRSIGNRKSQLDTQPARKSTLSKPMGHSNAELEKHEFEEDSPAKVTKPEVQIKLSTQPLQDRLSTLDKVEESQPSNISHHNILAAQAVYPDLPSIQPELITSVDTIPQPLREPTKDPIAIEEDDEDWIAPTKSAQTALPSQFSQQSLSPTRPGLHHKSISASNLPSVSKLKAASVFGHGKASSVSHPNLADTITSTTPIGSPSNKKTIEGTVSASKNRLWSALKNAKSLFASSASTSAAAKIEAHNNSPTRLASPKRDFSNESGTTAVFNMPGALYSEREIPLSPTRPISAISLTPKRTRSSAEAERKREKQAKEQQKATNNLEKAREKERKKANQQRQDETIQPEQEDDTIQVKQTNERPPSAFENERPPSVDIDGVQPNSKSVSAFKSSILSSGKIRAPGRPVRPTRGTAQSKPAPVPIRVASQSQRLGQGQVATSSLNKSQHESSAGSLAKEPSGSRPSSAQSNKSGPAAPVNARLKALEAAARKKEADERAAQKKAEQKRELERKRALKAEEEKRAEEERKAAEQQRVQEAKQAAQRKAEKQAADARRREQERVEQQRLEQERIDQERKREQERMEQARREQERLEQLRQQDDARKAREAHELAERINRERSQQAQQSHPRSDVGGTIRHLIKHTIPQLNPAKPAKRHMQPENDEVVQPQRPGVQRSQPSYQQNDAKRRRTNEEQDEPDQRRSVMAPPKRPSNLRKETLSKFPHGYTNTANPSASHHGAGILKSTATAQHQLYTSAKHPATHPSQMVHMSNARIPFAENGNPPAAYQSTTSQLHPGYENGHPSASANKFKTPARPGAHGHHHHKSAKSVKSSPLYQNGDNIALPDIATDSEDEDSGDEGGGGASGFRAPSWVASPALRDLLTQQQLVDPESVFGPIGELKMDEVFKGAKNPERLKRFRDRGSSALWVESGDAVTSAEKRRDMELRERVAREGGWRYEPGV